MAKERKGLDVGPSDEALEFIGRMRKRKPFLSSEHKDEKDTRFHSGHMSLTSRKKPPFARLAEEARRKK